MTVVEAGVISLGVLLLLMAVLIHALTPGLLHPSSNTVPEDSRLDNLLGDLRNGFHRTRASTPLSILP